MVRSAGIPKTTPQLDLSYLRAKYSSPEEHALADRLSKIDRRLGNNNGAIDSADEFFAVHAELDPQDFQRFLAYATRRAGPNGELCSKALRTTLDERGRALYESQFSKDGLEYAAWRTQHACALWDAAWKPKAVATPKRGLLKAFTLMFSPPKYMRGDFQADAMDDRATSERFLKLFPTRMLHHLPTQLGKAWGVFLQRNGLPADCCSEADRQYANQIIENFAT